MIKNYLNNLIFNGLISSITLSYIDICMGWTSNYTLLFSRPENDEGKKEFGKNEYAVLIFTGFFVILYPIIVFRFLLSKSNDYLSLKSSREKYGKLYSNVYL